MVGKSLVAGDVEGTLVGGSVDGVVVKRNVDELLVVGAKVNKVVVGGSVDKLLVVGCAVEGVVVVGGEVATAGVVEENAVVDGWLVVGAVDWLLEEVTDKVIWVSLSAAVQPVAGQQNFCLSMDQSCCQVAAPS